MKPVLATIGPITIVTQGIILFFAFVLAFYTLWKLYRYNLNFIRYKITIDQFFDSVFVFFISFGIGSRLLYIFEHMGMFIAHPVYTILFLHFPGFSFLGGILGGAMGIAIWARRIRTPFFLLSDTLVVGTTLAIAIARIGNFFQGDAYGKVTTFLGVKMDQLPGLRHPVQLYESFLLFLLFLFLYRIYKKGSKIQGRITFLFLTLLGIERFLIEFLRADGVYLWGISTAQILSLVFLAVGITGLVRNNKIKRVWQDALDWLYVDELWEDTKRFLRIKK